MAYRFITASKDASVYLQQPDQNTGLDEILEVSKVYYGNIKDVSRSLLKFNLNEFSASLSNGSVNLEEAKLILRETESEEIALNFDINIHPIAKNWEMGNGTRFDKITTSGVTWDHREGDTSLKWVEASDGIEPLFPVNTTGSFDGRGGIWHTTPISTQQFSYNTDDIVTDITPMVNEWISGSMDNHGIIVKHTDGVEENVNDYGILRFFSKETNTIHQPKLRIGWSDVSFNSGSLTELTNENIKVGIRNLKTNYRVNTIPKIRVVGRELFPIKAFSNLPQYGISKHLPQSSYYQIKDYESNDVIIPFSEYTKLSCDSMSNYFNLDLFNWEVDRVYKIEFKVIIDGSENIFDNKDTFTLRK